MPQFDFSQALPQLVWLALVFAILYVAVHALLPRVEKVVENRKTRIAADLAQAESARAAAEGAMSDSGQTLADARTRALKVTGKARDDAAAANARRIAEIDTSLEAEAERAAQDLAGRRQQVLAELDTVASEATVDLIRRVAGIEISREAAAEAVNKVAA